MKILTRTMYMQLGKFLVFATVPFVLLGVPAQAQLTGSLSIAENTCVLPIATPALTSGSGR
jgi:hypothetical protein